MPRASDSSSSPLVITFWPFLATTIAVPVSWHEGSTMPEATFAFFSSSRATKRSLSDASGSSRIFDSCCRCPGRSRKETSRMASCASRVSTAPSIFRIVRPSKSTVLTPSLPRLR